MINWIKKILNSKLRVGIAVVIVLLVGYAIYRTFSGGSTITHYVLAQVEKGTIVASISGSGQVSALQQVDVKSKASGDVVYVAIKDGQPVRAGALLAQVDSTNASKAVRDAQLALANAKITLEKFKLDQGTTQQTRTGNLQKYYDDGFNQMAGAYSDLVNIVAGAHGVLYDNTLKGTCSPNLCQYGNYFANVDNSRAFASFQSIATSDLVTAEKSYNLSLDKYSSLRLAEVTPDILKPMMNETLILVRQVAQAVKSEQNLINNLVSYLNQTYNSSASAVPAQITTYQNNLESYTTILNGRISTFLAAINSISAQEQSISSATLGDPLDISNQENLVSQKEAALVDAQIVLANCYVRAPFAGTVAKVAIKRGDLISSATTVATMITPQQVATISLNEVDVAKIKVGQKATITFDAVSDLIMTGQVLTVDTIGTVSQGVVTYNVQISFDTQADGIKTGMSVTANVITDSKIDALLINSSAVKTTAGSSYVLVVDQPPAVSQTSASATGIELTTKPRQQTVQTGLISDSTIEIISGLKAGDTIVAREITVLAGATPAPATGGAGGTNILRQFGGTTGGR